MPAVRPPSLCQGSYGCHGSSPRARRAVSGEGSRCRTSSLWLDTSFVASLSVSKESGFGRRDGTYRLSALSHQPLRGRARRPTAVNLLLSFSGLRQIGPRAEAPRRPVAQHRRKQNSAPQPPRSAARSCWPSSGRSMKGSVGLRKPTRSSSRVCTGPSARGWL